MSTTNKIALYKFQDSVENARMIVAGNLFLALFLMMFGFGTNTNTRLLICVVTAIIFYVIYKTYDWKLVNVNIFLIVFYMGIICVETILLDIPGRAAYLNKYDVHVYNKGMMLDFFIAASPYIYVGVKIFLVIPLVQVFLRSRNLNQ